MKNSTRVLSIVFVILACLFSRQAQATHYKGGDTYFICLGNGQYELVFAAYFACEPTSIAYDTAAADFEWQVTSTCGLPTFIQGQFSTPPVDVPFYCPGVLTQCDYYNPNLGNPYSGAPANAPVGTLVIRYTSAPFTIPPGCTVSATMEVGSRNGSIANLVNPGSTSISIEATITTPTDGSCNNTPQFAQDPVNIFCLGQNANFSQGAIDLSGDSLTYTLINPRNSGGIPIPFVAGCTPSNPLGAPNVYASTFNFDSATGNVNFTPTSTGNYVLAVQVNAYHNGVLVGSTIRDIQFTVVICNNIIPPPFLTSLLSLADVTGGVVIDSTHVGACPGETVTINLVASTRDSFNYIVDSTNAALSLPGSIISVTHTGTVFDTATIHISWTPQGSDSGYHYILLQVRDTSCPMPGRQTYAFLVSVLSGVYAGPNQVYCNGGQPVTIHASGANHYLWTDSATGGPPHNVISYGPDSSYIVVAPSTTSGYIVHGDLLGGCRNTDTVTIINAPLFTLSAAAVDTSICKYTSTIISTTPTPSSVGPFVYSWSPDSLVTSPTAATTPTIGLTSSTEFRVTVTAAGGCAITDSVHVSINGAAPRINIMASNNNVCPGDTVNLSSTVLTENLVTCGLTTVYPPNNFINEGEVGSDNTTTTGGTGFTNIQGSPFSGSYTSYKAQYLFTAAELNAAGLSSGTITDIAFYVQTVNSTVAYDTFAVSMGCTNQTTLSNFVNNLQEVLPPQYGFNAITPTPGYTSLLFTNYFNWDGASNIIVQVCYTLPQTSADDYVAYTTTTYPGSTIYAGALDFEGAGNGCNLSYASTFDYGILNTRPNIKFDMSVPNVLTYQWSPHTLACDTCAYTSVVVTKDTTYKLTVSDGTCTNDTTVRIFINPYLATTAVPDTTICLGDTVQLHVSLTNPPPTGCVTGYSVDTLTYATIAGTATAITPLMFVDAFGSGYNTDNGTAGPLNIGFTFPFYCQNYTNFYVNSNGWVSFVNPYANNTGGPYEYTPELLPAGSPNPLKAIELMMGNYYLADGFGDGGGNIKYLVSGIAPNRILVIRFTNMKDVNLASVTTGEMHLHETTGEIDILLKSSTYSDFHTTGVIDTPGIGTAAPGRNDQIYTITTPEAWKFMPQYGASVAVSSSIWSPNISISDTLSTSPLVYPSSSQNYYVVSNLVLNQFTNPTLCAVHDTVRVNISNFQHSLTVAPNPICPGDTAQITFNPMGTTVASYLWTPALGLSSTTIANPTASVLDTTTYHVTATDPFGCKVKDSITLDILPVQHPTIGPSATICYSDSVKLELSGAYTNYRWYEVDTLTGTRTLVSSGAADSVYYAHPSAYYVLEVNSAGGACPYFTNLVYVDSFLKQPIYIDTTGPTSFCNGDSVRLSTQPGLNGVQWSPSSYGSDTSFLVTAPGNFSYSAVDGHGCIVFSNSVTVHVNPLPVFELGIIKNPICSGDTDHLFAQTSPSGASITWTHNSIQTANSTLAATDSGTYYIEANLAGCINDSSISIHQATSPSVSLGPDQTACNCTPQFVLAPAVSPVSASDSFTWSDGTHGTTITDSQLGQHSYSLTVTDGNNCTSTASVVLTFNCPRVDIIVHPLTDTTFVGDTATLIAVRDSTGTPASGYHWLPAANVLNQDNDSAHVTTPTAGLDTFYVISSDANNCTDTVAKVINVIQFGNFVMATAFTPNGDDKNPNFYPKLSGGDASTARVTVLRIYNKWGQLVYDNPSPPGWNGDFTGTPQQTGTYLYFVTIEYPDPTNAAKTLQKSVEGSFGLFR